MLYLLAHVPLFVCVCLCVCIEYTPEEVEDALSDSSKQIVAHSIPDTTRKLLYTFDESIEPSHTLATYQLVMLCTGGVLVLAFLCTLWFCVCSPKIFKNRNQQKFYHRFEDDFGGDGGGYVPPTPPAHTSSRSLFAR